MNPVEQVAAAQAQVQARFDWFFRGCPTTPGPAQLPCQRTDPHTRGHVWDAGDVADRHDEAVSEQ